tara:strand:- start:428 stop:706 length:279 start_codon:yes stop_codon:yes gene_type:complete
MMQTDVKSAFCPVSATTVVTTNRTRLKGMFICYPSGGLVTVRDGAGGPIIFNFDDLAVIGTVSVVIPGEGVLAPNGIVVETSAATTVNIFYG